MLLRRRKHNRRPPLSHPCCGTADSITATQLRCTTCPADCAADFGSDTAASAPAAPPRGSDSPRRCAAVFSAAALAACWRCTVAAARAAPDACAEACACCAARSAAAVGMARCASAIVCVAILRSSSSKSSELSACNEHLTTLALPITFAYKRNHSAKACVWSLMP